MLVVPLAGGPVRELPEMGSHFIDFSPDGELVAAVTDLGPEEESIIKVWNLESDEVQTLGPVPGESAYLGFDDDRRLRWSGMGSTKEGDRGERVFNLEDGSIEVVAEEGKEYLRVVNSLRTFILVTEIESVQDDRQFFWRSLESGESRRITTHGNSVEDVAIGPSDQWMVTGSFDGVVRVGPISGVEPHLLFGHKGLVQTVAVSPDGRWIASGGYDGTVRLWPTPDLSKPPLHTRPLDELLATLHSLTNLRVVEDPESSTGWQVETGPFPGWEELPTW